METDEAGRILNSYYIGPNWDDGSLCARGRDVVEQRKCMQGENGAFENTPSRKLNVHGVLKAEFQTTYKKDTLCKKIVLLAAVKITSVWMIFFFSFLFNDFFLSYLSDTLKHNFV